MTSRQKLSVFVSSTCYDLKDVRAQLRNRLEAAQFTVRMSDVSSTDFRVDPFSNSIETCKLNVELSDVVVCILDGRYGPPLPDPYSPKSATEVEVQHAWKIGKPVFTFIRDEAYTEYSQLRKSSSFTTHWVEPNRQERRDSWTHFVTEIANLAEVGNRSNWLDLFSTVIDLCDRVESRLYACFPTAAAGMALRPERVVRIIFCADGTRAHFKT
jgi:hypothetical protein